MSLFKIKRSEDFEDEHVEAYLNTDGEYGTDDEAIFFKSRKEAQYAIENDRWDSTGDYTYNIEQI